MAAEHEWIRLILVGLFVLISGSFTYTWWRTESIWKFLQNHLHDRIEKEVRKQLNAKR